MLELSLNLLWLTVSLLLVGLWIRHGRAGSSRTRQALTLAMVLLLLLPVISMSDDLVSAQNPAETDTLLRKASDGTHRHLAVHPALYTVPAPLTQPLLPQLALLLPAQPSTTGAPGFSPAHAARPPPQA